MRVVVIQRGVEDSKLKVLERSYHCAFCHETTFGPDLKVSPNCRNCGLEIDHSGEDSPRRAPILDPDTLQIRISVRPEKVEELRQLGKRRAKRKALIITGMVLAVCVSCVVGMVSFLTPSPSTIAVAESEEPEPQDTVLLQVFNATQMEVSLAGYDASPLWVAAVNAEHVVSLGDNRTVLIVTRNDATIYDASTGDIMERQMFAQPSDTIAGQTSDMYVVKADGSLFVWTDVTGWATGDIDEDATLRQHGTEYVTSMTGDSISDINADATLSPLLAPGDDATLVTASLIESVWSTGDTVTIVTRDSDAAATQVTLTPHQPGMTLTRILTADQRHIYALWESDTETRVTVHERDTGDAFNDANITTTDDETVLLMTQDKQFLSIANVTIDALTGATAHRDDIMQQAVTDRFFLHIGESALLINPSTGEEQNLGALGEVKILSGSSSLLFVSTPEGVAAIAQSKTKEPTE